MKIIVAWQHLIIELNLRTRKMRRKFQFDLYLITVEISWKVCILLLLSQCTFQIVFRVYVRSFELLVYTHDNHKKYECAAAMHVAIFQCFCAVLCKKWIYFRNLIKWCFCNCFMKNIISWVHVKLQYINLIFRTKTMWITLRTSRTVRINQWRMNNKTKLNNQWRMK